MTLKAPAWVLAVTLCLLASCVTSRQEQLDEHPERNPGLSLLNQAKTPGDCRLHIVDCIDATYDSEPARKLCRARFQACLDRTTNAQRSAASSDAPPVPQLPAQKDSPSGGASTVTPTNPRVQPPLAAGGTSGKTGAGGNIISLDSLAATGAAASISLPADDATGRAKTVVFKFPKDASHCLVPKQTGNEVQLLNKCTEPVHSVIRTDNMRGQRLGGYTLLDNSQDASRPAVTMTPYVQGPYEFGACFANERFCTAALLVSIGNCTQYLRPMPAAQGYPWNLRSTAYPLDCAAGAEQRKTNMFGSRTNAFERFNVEAGRRVLDFMNTYLPTNAARSADQLSRCVVGLHTGILKIVVSTRDEFQKKEGLPRSSCEQSLFGGS